MTNFDNVSFVHYSEAGPVDFTATALQSFPDAIINPVTVEPEPVADVHHAIKLTELRRVLAMVKRQSDNSIVRIACGVMAIQSYGFGHNNDAVMASIPVNDSSRAWTIDLIDFQRALKGHKGSFTINNDKLLSDAGEIFAPVDAEVDSDGFSELGEHFTPDGEFIAINPVMLKRAVISQAQQDVRYYLNGVGLRSDGAVVSTDGHRLYASDLNLAESVKHTIPGNVAKLLSTVKHSLMVRTGDDLEFTVGLDNWTISASFIDGKFPDYVRVIPDAPLLGTVNRKAFIAELRRLEPVANPAYKGVRMEFSGESIALQVNNPDGGEYHSTIDCSDIPDGVTCETGFNLVYLIDALNQFTGETVALHKDPDNQNSLCIKDGDGLAVVMPMRL